MCFSIRPQPHDAAAGWEASSTCHATRTLWLDRRWLEGNFPATARKCSEVEGCYFLFCSSTCTCQSILESWVSDCRRACLSPCSLTAFGSSAMTLRRCACWSSPGATSISVWWTPASSRSVGCTSIHSPCRDKLGFRLQWYCVYKSAADVCWYLHDEAINAVCGGCVTAGEATAREVRRGVATLLVMAVFMEEIMPELLHEDWLRVFTGRLEFLSLLVRHSFD